MDTNERKEIIVRGSRALNEQFRTLINSRQGAALRHHCIRNHIMPDVARIYYGTLLVYARAVQERHGAAHFIGVGASLEHVVDDGVDGPELGAYITRAMIAAKQFSDIDPITGHCKLRDDIMPQEYLQLLGDTYASFKATVGQESPDFINAQLSPADKQSFTKVISATIERITAA